MLCGQWTSGKLDAQLRIGTEILNIVGDAGSDLIFANGTKRDLSHWSVYLRGPSQGAKGTPEESGWFALDIPVEYKPPKLRTAERCSHAELVAEALLWTRMARMYALPPPSFRDLGIGITSSL